MKLYSQAAIIILLAAAIGCSGTSVNPVQPPDTPANAVESTSVDTNHMLWGMWNFGIDLETLTATAVPDRGIETHLNVLPFLSPPKCYDCIKLHINSFDDVTRILDIDVTIRNQYALVGHDVRGILFTDALGHLLKNEDAWTALYDIPGGDTINPFKAFAKDEIQRMFPAQGQLTENYRIWVPDPPKYLTIKYAVDASFPGNCEEPYQISNFMQDPIYNLAGSQGLVNVDVNDWQDNANAVSVEAPDLNDSPIALTHGSGNTWSGSFINQKGAATGDYPVKITATSSLSGTTALYWFAKISTSEPPAVEGGWARTWDPSIDPYDDISVAVDGSGNSYVAGKFVGEVDLDPGNGVDMHIAPKGYNVYLSKFDSYGNFIWARTWGSEGEAYAHSVATDSSGNVYVTGSYSGNPVDFDPDPIATDPHPADGSWARQDVFVSKFDSTGDFVWARTWGGADDVDEGTGVAVDASGNVFVTGTFSGTVDFNPDPSADDFHTSAARYDCFISKFDSSGTFAWAQTWGGTVAQTCNGIAVDGSGSAYVVGIFLDSVDFNPDPVLDDLHTANGDNDVFMSKFDSSGIFQWARTWGNANGADDVFGITFNGLGNLYVTGQFYETVDFNPDPVGVDNHTAITNDAYLSAFDSDGKFVWARTWGGTGSVAGKYVASDGSGNAYVTGHFQGTADFDPGAGVDDHTCTGPYLMEDAFLSKLDSSGTFIWARTWGGDYQDYSNGVAADASGHAYAVGTFYGTVDFDPGSGIDNHKSFDTSGFLIKFMPDGNW